MSNQNEEPTTNDPDTQPSLSDVLKAVQRGQHEASKADDRDVRRFVKLSKEIGELAERMDTIDQFLQNPFAALFPVDMQLRITSQTQADGTTSLSLSAVPPQAQAQPVRDQGIPASAPVDTPIDGDDEEVEHRPRRNPSRQKPTKETTTISTTKLAQASKKNPKPSFFYGDSITNRALPPSPPRMGKGRPSKGTVDRLVTLSARDEREEDSDDGVDEIPAVAENPKRDKNGKKQQISKRIKTTATREGALDHDGDEVGLDADDDDEDDNVSTPAQMPLPNKSARLHTKIRSKAQKASPMTETVESDKVLTLKQTRKSNPSAPNRRERRAKRSSESTGQKAK